MGDIETLIRQTITNYNDSDLQNFDVVFRHSKLSRLIDASDGSILSNTTRITLNKILTPVLNTVTQYVIDFNNPLYNPHTGHNSAMGGITSSTGFTISTKVCDLFYKDKKKLNSKISL